MHYSSVVIVLCLAVNILGYPLDVVQNEDGEAFALVPLSRVRRAEVYGHADITDPGRAFIGIKGTPIDNAEHRLDTNVYATKNILHHSPITKGAEASYLHIPTNSNLDLSIQNTPQMGTDFRASGKYNYFQDKTTNANVEAFYDRRWGGQPGSSRSDHGIMFNFRKDF